MTDIDGLPVPAGRRIALIAHDNKKQDMLECRGMFADHLPPAADPRAGRSRDVAVNE